MTQRGRSLTLRFTLDLLGTLRFVNFVLVAAFFAAPIVIGAYMVFFSRRFSLAMYRYRKAVWKIGFTDTEVRVGQAATLVIGVGLLIGGLIVATQQLIRWGMFGWGGA